ncbi:sigma-70 family RNA polymerase sigma factor [Methylobacillus gramineus]|uniref:sigma-70 family RNA polymerase sigma factor n=1 Tax=Methylobacillus gramineus TaxID=755169 RepID=UPI001CFFEE3B|nr:sigma-70 family RNA polymerase sigma factor [Methylobacillus gramineus]MCB5185759.1 sigma-70 family RNA polymerase sigma factor [Methylobacillus gramineus]
MSSAIPPSHTELLRTLYLDHQGWLQSWLRHKLGCRHQAADLSQETFSRIFSVSRVDLAALKTPRAYLTTTATRLMIDQARRQKVEQAYMEALALSQDGLHAISPEQHLLTMEALTMIVGMLDTMAEKPRQAFMLSRLEHLTYPEIGTVLGVSSSMVKQYIAQAMVHCHDIVHSNDVFV